MSLKNLPVVTYIKQNFNDAKRLELYNKLLKIVTDEEGKFYKKHLEQYGDEIFSKETYDI